MPACVAKLQTRPVTAGETPAAESSSIRRSAAAAPVVECSHEHLTPVQPTSPSTTSTSRIAFYRDALGLEVANDVGSGGHRWVTLGSADQPGLEIVLSDPHAGRSQADGDALQELLTKGVLPMIVFRTDDLDATFERVRASGAEVLQEPIDQPWSPRDCAFRDPSGNTVRILQSAQQPQSA